MPPVSTTTTYGPLDFARDTGVPRETLSRLSTYVNLLVERNENLNLVAPSTLPHVWRRHVLDSAQLVPLILPHATTIVDLGSGAGFPGLVLAIMLSDRPGPSVHLIEATQKKCRFLEEVIAATMAPAQVHWTRAEQIKGLKADVVTARALAPLNGLLRLAHPFFGPSTTGLFLKGRSLNDELTQAGKSWKLVATPIPSQSDPSGSILRVTGLSPWRKPRKPS
ncbi:MAG: 16S rRNA (guanine(527)-N(7))-methyltransferase RsmG [Alphaproteobacteria bacterium]|nr:16S rRNA (guanine(527)-N(7))-methyltransferase RsmG [Alphaproteobacteria bacterium]